MGIDISQLSKNRMRSKQTTSDKKKKKKKEHRTHAVNPSLYFVLGSPDCSNTHIGVSRNDLFYNT
ncbi:hypothetical protein POVCU2_0023360, partial [Plasmodium ovale curtisi]